MKLSFGHTIPNHEEIANGQGSIVIGTCKEPQSVEKARKRASGNVALGSKDLSFGYHQGSQNTPKKGKDNVHDTQTNHDFVAHLFPFLLIAYNVL